MDRQPDPTQAALAIRPMTPDDLPTVIEIERTAFRSGWPPTAFRRELEHNRLARYLVLLEGGAVAGFAGLWLMLDEAHVVTVAVRPERQRRGYGRLLVHALLRLAAREGMSAATLECRVSNEPARRLYGQYGFYEVGLRKRYYSDNKEDAVIMTTEELESEAFRHRLVVLGEQLEGRVPGAMGLLGAI